MNSMPQSVPVKPCLLRTLFHPASRTPSRELATWASVVAARAEQGLHVYLFLFLRAVTYLQIPHI